VETNPAGRVTRIFIEPVAEAADQPDHLDLSGGGEENLKLDFALDLLFASFRGLSRFGLVSDFNGRQVRICRYPGHMCASGTSGVIFAQARSTDCAVAIATGAGRLTGIGAVPEAGAGNVNYIGQTRAFYKSGKLPRPWAKASPGPPKFALRVPIALSIGVGKNSE
jgi:hypothetical protein